MGYYWARAEADLNMAPLAESRRAFIASASKAGQMSGERRRDIAEETWRRDVRQAAVKIRAADPSLSQPDLAAEVIYELGNDAVPSHPTITEYIRELEREGLLPRKLLPRKKKKSAAK